MSRILILISIALMGLANCQSNNGTTNATTIGTTTTTTVTNQTTVEPKTTTTSAPVTTTATPVTPTMPPTPERWTGNVTQNYTCIIAQFAVQITIKYNNTNNTEVTTGFDIPVNATVDKSNSFCTNITHEEQLTITFSNEELTSANLTLVFNNISDAVLVEEVLLSYNLTEQLFPGFHDPKQYNKIVKNNGKAVNLFKVAKVHSYVCEAAQTAQLNESTPERVTNGAEIHFTNSKVEAYISQSQKGNFDTEINCKSTEVSDVVPIAVGAALAGLVVIVLIAYFIGRRRSRRLAYQSV